MAAQFQSRLVSADGIRRSRHVRSTVDRFKEKLFFGAFHNAFTLEYITMGLFILEGYICTRQYFFKKSAQFLVF